MLIVSNRMPATVRIHRDEVKLVPSTGGLATGLTSVHEESNGLWFGWPGSPRKLSPRQRATLDRELAARRLVPIHLSSSEVRRFYHGFSNGVLWPLFHYALEHMPPDSSDWRVYVKVNERFADAVAAEHRKGDLIWVHDYQLAILPRLLRERIPDARIAFFLHIPFPSSEVFRILPWRAEILRGMLGADLIGFHTLSYLRHFSLALLRILGLETEIDRLWLEEREVRLGVHPLGIDGAQFDAMARDERLIAEAASIREQSGHASIVLGVDRLDYSKGIPRRLLAFERLLEREPDLHGRVHVVQVAAPSREEVRAYADLERNVDELVGRINGRFGSARWTPIRYVHRALSQRRIVSLYLASDVLCVTPLRDGMNLVAKEYIAARPDLGGALVLSEFAGAASELPEAFLVNPYDVDTMAQAIGDALRATPEERALRFAPMRQRVLRHGAREWSESILGDLRAAGRTMGSVQVLPRRGATRRRLLRRLRAAERILLFLDYDGTLVPLKPTPELAAPDPPLLELLAALGHRPGTVVHVVSGRDAKTLEDWLGRLPVWLHAEHGLASRDPSTAEWNVPVSPDVSWKEKVRPILDTFTRATPGSFVEEKSAGLTWHYALAEPEFGPAQALELRVHLLELLSNVPVQVVAGERVVEVRAQGVSKGGIVARMLAAEPAGALAVAVGDDATDEDLFAAVPEQGIAIHVGPSRSRAGWRIPDPHAVRALLEELLARAPLRALRS